MIWLLAASALLNLFLWYAWFHDLRRAEKSYDRLEKTYHDTLDFLFSKPRGSTGRELAERWPEGSRIRAESEQKNLDRYGKKLP